MQPKYKENNLDIFKEMFPVMSPEQEAIGT